MKNQQTLFVKNMVCPRCVLAVEHILHKSGINYKAVEQGEIILEKDLSAEKLETLESKLKEVGFELIASRMTKLIEDIKLHTQAYLKEKPESAMNLSDYLRERIPNDYSYLSDLFSSTEGISIEQYFIRLRIEKVKELLVYDQLSLKEIAYQTGFSSVHHLSAQFKKQTGLTPTFFRRTAAEKRLAAKNLGT